LRSVSTMFHQRMVCFLLCRPPSIQPPHVLSRVRPRYLSPGPVGPHISLVVCEPLFLLRSANFPPDPNNTVSYVLSMRVRMPVTFPEAFDVLRYPISRPNALFGPKKHCIEFCLSFLPLLPVPARLDFPFSFWLLRCASVSALCGFLCISTRESFSRPWRSSYFLS